MREKQTKRIGPFLERFRARARELLDDTPGVEALLGQARKRAERYGALREALDPLLRLVRSYTRGSYRQADLGDVVWALTAVIYVASPVDALPDLLPGGLKDDERVVVWVTERIQGTLDAYEAWERSLGEQEFDDTARSLELTESDVSLDVRVLDPVDSALFRSSTPAEHGAPPIALQPLVATVGAVKDSLQAGEVVRVLGPPHLLEGLRDHSLVLVRSGEKTLGRTRDAASGHFAGDLDFDFSNLESQGATISPLAAFQVASAVTLQYYLARIDRQLGEIDRKLGQALQDKRDDRYGDIETARARCTTVEQAAAKAGSVGNTDARRLDLAAQDLDTTYNALRSSVEAFCERAEQLDPKTVSKKELKTLLDDGCGMVLTDARLLLFAAVVRHRIHGVQVLLHQQDGEQRVRMAIEHVESEQRKMLSLLLRMQKAFKKVHMPKQMLDERWGQLGGPEKSLREYSAATAPLREQLAESRAALPPAAPEEPFMAEIRMRADDTIEMEWAPLRPADETQVTSDRL